MKFSWMLVISLGIFFSAIALGWGYREWDPNMKEVRSWTAYRDQLIPESKKYPQAIKRVQDAEALATAKVNEWRNIAATRTLPPTLQQGGIDLSINGWQLLTQMPLFRNSIQKMVNNQLKVGGVKVLTGPTIPATPTDPNQIVSQYFNVPVLPPVVIFDLGTITVQGTYKQITDNMRAWSRMPHFLAVADGLSLRGTSPRLIGTYAVSIVGFVQTTKPIFPAVPEGGRLISTAPAGGVGAVNAATGGAAQGRGANVPGAANALGGRPGGPGRGAATPPVPPIRTGAGNPATLPPAGQGRRGPGAGQAANPPAGANRPGAPAGAAARPGAGARPGAAAPGAAGRGAAGQPAAGRGAATPGVRRPGANQTPSTAGAGGR